MTKKTRNRQTEKAMYMSIISTALCVVMLIGMTFAWFTSTVESSQNIIKTANFDVDVLWSDDISTIYATSQSALDSTKWHDLDINSTITNNNSQPFNELSFLPGQEVVRYIAMYNKSAFNVKFDVSLRAITDNDTESDALLNALEIYTVEPVAAGNAVTSSGMTKKGSAADLKKDDENALTQISSSVVEKATDPAEKVTVMAIAIKLPESYSNPVSETVNFYIKVIASQWNVEHEEATATFSTATPTIISTPKATVTVPTTAKTEDNQAISSTDTLTLSVIPGDADANLTVETGNGTTTYEVTLTNQNNVKVISDVGIKVDLDIGVVDLQEFYHNTTPLTLTGDTNNDNVVDASDVTVLNTYFYNVNTGIITFITDSFSPFTSTYKFAGGLGTEEYPYKFETGEQWYSLIKEYNGKYIDSLYISIIADLDMKGYSLDDFVTYPKNFTFEGNGHTIKNLDTTIWGYYGDYYGNCSISNITVEDSFAKYSIFGYGPYGSGDSVNVTNVTIKNSEANGGMFMYYTGAAEISFNNCIVENSLVHGPNNMAGGGFVGNGQGITINNCKFGGTIVAESTNIIAGFVGQGKATIKNSEISEGTVIRSIANDGKVAAYDGQGGGAAEGDNNTFNGILCCDKESNAKKQGTNATWQQFVGLNSADFSLAEDGTIAYTGENRNFSKITISEYLFQRSAYYKDGNSGQSGKNAYILGGYSCYWENLISADVTSNVLYKVDRVKNIVNVVSNTYANKIACATTTVPDVEWTSYGSYLDRESGTLYYNGVCSDDAVFYFIGETADVTNDGVMTPKANPFGDFYIVIKAYDENNGILGSVTLSYRVNFAN